MQSIQCHLLGKVIVVTALSWLVKILPSEYNIPIIDIFFFPQFASEVIYKINMIAILWVLSVFCWKIRVPSISERNASLCSDVFFFFLYFIYLWFYLWSLRNVVHYISGATVHQSSFYMNKLLIWQWLTENSRLSVILFYFFNKRVVNNLIHKISNYQLQKY